MNRQQINVIANMFSKAWAILSNFLFIPLYISVIGEVSYGLIAFYTTIVIIVNIADSGMSPALTRDVVKLKDPLEKRNAVKSVEFIYTIISVLLILILIASFEVISSNFIKIDGLNSDTKNIIVVLMFAAAILQLFMAPYKAGLMGLEKQVYVSMFIILFSVFRLLLPLVFLRINPSLEYFFVYQVIISLIFLVIIRNKLWKILKKDNATICLVYLRSIKTFCLSMLLITIMTAINMQLDKVLVAYYFNLEQLTVYSIATMLALSAYTITQPIITSYYPKMNSLIPNSSESKKLYFNVNYYIISLSAFIVTIVLLYHKDILLLWTNSSVIAESATPVIIVYTLGTFFLTLQLLPFHLGLSNNYNKVNLYLGVVFLVFTPLFEFFSIPYIGLLGAAIPWLISNFIYALFLNIIVLKKYMPGEVINIFVYTVMPQITVILILVTALYSSFLWHGVWLINLTLIAVLYCLFVVLYEKIYLRKKLLCCYQ